MGVLDDILNRRRGVMTRQEAVKPTPAQAIGQLSQTMPPQSAGTVNQVEIPRRTHQSAAGGAMPVGRSTAPVATNGYTYDQAAEGMKRFHGNVDLYHRPVVSSEAMNNAGYNIPAGNTATVYSMQRGIRDKSGRVREVLYTPITATGEVMSQKDIDAYIDGLDGSDDILAADKAGKGMIIHLDANPNGNDGQDLHLMQEAYGRGPQASAEGKSDQVTQPGQVITPQQAKDAVDKVAHDIQQRADTRKQEELARNRHQNSADPMNRLFNPATKQQSTGQDSSNGNTEQQKVSDLAGVISAIDVPSAKQKLDEATETPEQKEARERREKRQALMAKIGDGLSAFHEAYSHMMGNKPMTSGSTQAKHEARIKALGLERDKKYKDALSNYLKVLEMQQKADYQNAMAATRKAQQESMDRDRSERRKMQQETNDARVALYKARMGKYLDESSFTLAYNTAIASGMSEADAIKAGLAASAANQEELARQQKAESDAKVKAGEAQANQRNAAANASNARAAKTKASGSGRSSGSYTTTTHEKVIKNGRVVSEKEKTTTKSPGGGSRSSRSGNSNGKGKNRYSKVKTR